MPAEIREILRTELSRPVLIEGFPGVGMIGTAAALHLVKELDMELCGYIESEKFPPFCAIHGGIPMPPARIYKSDEHNVLVLLSEFVIPLNAVYEVCDEIIKWSRSKRVSMIYSLGGIGALGIQASSQKVFGVGSTPAVRKMLESNNVTIINEGATTGVTGVLLSKSMLENFPAASLLTQSRKPEAGVDLISAAAVVGKLGEITGLKISTKKLIKEGLEIETKIKDILAGAKDAEKKYKKVEESPMYR